MITHPGLAGEVSLVSMSGPLTGCLDFLSEQGPCQILLCAHGTWHTSDRKGMLHAVWSNQERMSAFLLPQPILWAQFENNCSDAITSYNKTGFEIYGVCQCKGCTEKVACWPLECELWVLLFRRIPHCLPFPLFDLGDTLTF